MADRFWLDAVLIASQSRFGLGSSDHIHGASDYWGAPDTVDGQGIYCLDAGISDEYQPETDAVEFVLEKLVIGSAVAMAVVFQSEFRRFLEQLGAENFGSYFNRPVALPTLIV